MDASKLESRVIEITILLACVGKTQIESFPNFVHVPDEIALELDDTINLLQNSDFNKMKYNYLKLINKIFSTKAGNSHFWTIECILSGKEWKVIRDIATRGLVELSIEMRKPNLFWVSYIKDNYFDK